jgi:hypothetical protein
MTVDINDRVFNARPDTVDFRDLLYRPALIEVPPRRDLDEYRRYGVPVLDQGTEGACTGFGRAAVANFLLRRRAIEPNVGLISARMLYEMARRYDEWEGEDYEVRGVCCVVRCRDVRSRLVVRAGGQMALVSSVNAMARRRPAGSAVAIS